MKIAILVAGILLGFALHHFIFPANKPAKALEEKVTSLADNEMRAYAESTDVAEKLEKAKILYEKIMMIFLADLGLRIKFAEVKPIEAPLKEIPMPSDLPENENSPSVSTSAPKYQKTNFENSNKKEKKESAPKNDKEVALQYFQSKFISKMDETMKKMTGVFKGFLKIQVGKNKGKIHKIEMDLNLFEVGKKIDGTTRVELFDETGVSYSRSNGDGGNRSIKQDPNNPNTIYVDVSPDTFFVLSLDKYPALMGDYFKNNQKSGAVELTKEMQ